MQIIPLIDIIFVESICCNEVSGMWLPSPMSDKMQFVNFVCVLCNKNYICKTGTLTHSLPQVHLNKKKLQLL